MSVSAHAADNKMVIAQEDSKQVASFKLYGSVCTLKADVIGRLPASAYRKHRLCIPLLMLDAKSCTQHLWNVMAPNCDVLTGTCSEDHYR